MKIEEKRGRERGEEKRREEMGRELWGEVAK